MIDIQDCTATTGAIPRPTQNTNNTTNGPNQSAGRCIRISGRQCTQSNATAGSPANPPAFTAHPIRIPTVPAIPPLFNHGIRRPKHDTNPHQSTLPASSVASSTTAPHCASCPANPKVPSPPQSRLPRPSSRQAQAQAQAQAPGIRFVHDKHSSLAPKNPKPPRANANAQYELLYGKPAAQVKPSRRDGGGGSRYDPRSVALEAGAEIQQVGGNRQGPPRSKSQAKSRRHQSDGAK